MDIKARLLKLHCPFTWEISISMILDNMKHFTTHVDNDNDKDKDDIDVDGSCPVELLMRCLLICYKAVLSADNDVEKKIEKAEQFLMQVQQEQELCQRIRAIEHVFYATKCFILYEENKMDELEEILKNIDNDNFSNAEIGTLHGCQSIVWCSLYDFGMDKAVNFATKAVEMDQDYALWHYILAKCLRRQRRLIQFSSSVGDKEEKHFELAYAISNNPVFGIYYLQMRYEKFYAFIKTKDYAARKAANNKQVLKIAKDILRSEPTNCNVLLKLALLFLRSYSDETQSAKKCLDIVEKIAPHKSAYLHYYALLHEQCGEFREALAYYKKAADRNNFIAELGYVRYGWETGELEPLPYLLRMLKKYEHLVKERQITMLLAIAVTYYSLHKDLSNAAEYFLKALTLDPSNKMFKIFYRFLDFNTPNITKFLKTHFLFETTKYQAKNPTFEQTCLKLKVLLNTMDKDDLTSLDESTHSTKEHYICS